MKKRSRITYRPNKGRAALTGVVGVIFVFIGLASISNTGAFGVFWTILAVIITGINLYEAFGKGYIGPEIRMEEEGGSATPKERLEQLQTLYDQRLITQEEYEAKRSEILKEL